MKVRAKFDGVKVKHGKIYNVISLGKDFVSYSPKRKLIVMLLESGKGILEVHCLDVHDFNRRWDIV